MINSSNRFKILSKCKSEFIKLCLNDSNKFKHILNENLSESEMIDQCIFFLLDNRNRIIYRLHQKQEKNKCKLIKIEEELKIANIKNSILLSILVSQLTLSIILFYIRNYEYI